MAKATHPTIKRKAPSSEHWNTPPWVLEVVRGFGPIGLDPCSNRWSLVGASTAWTKRQDGFSRCWCGHGLVYVNPPYSRGNLPKWVPRCAVEGDEVIALVPADTSTEWFASAVWELAQAVCFIRGRVTYFEKGQPRIGKDGRIMAAPHGSALVYYGTRPARFEGVTREVGHVLRLGNVRRPHQSQIPETERDDGADVIPVRRARRRR